MAVELATAYVSIIPSTRGMKRNLQDQLGGPVAEAGRREGGRFGSFLTGAASRSLKVGGVAVAAAFAASVSKGFNRLRAIDDARFKLQGLGHDASAVDAIMGSALASVEGTAFGLEEAATIAAGAVAAGIDPGEALTRTLSLTGDAATIAGVGLDEMGSIFGKVAASNRMMTEEMNQLADRGLPVLQWLQDEYGITADAARDMVSSGQVDFAAFQRMIEDNIGGAALTAGQSFGGSFANMGAAIGRFGAVLLGPAFERAPELFGNITAGIDRMTASVGPAISSAVAWIRNLGSSLGGNGEVVSRLASLRASFASIWSSITTIVQGAFDIVRAIVGPQLLAIKLLWDQFGTAIMAAVSFAFDHIVNIVQTVMGVVAGLVDVVAGILTGDWSRAWEGARGIVLSVLAGVHRTVLNFWGAFGGFITRNIDALVGWFRALPGRIADGLKALPTLVGFIVGRMVRVAVELVSGMVSSILGFIGSLPGRIADHLRAVAARIRDAVTSWRGEGGRAGQGVLDSIRGKLAELPSLVREMIGNAISAIRDMATRAFNSAQDVASGLWSGFKAGLGISSPSFIEDAMTAIASNVLSQTDALAGQVGRMHRLASGIPSMSFAPVTPSIRAPQAVRGGDGAVSPAAAGGFHVHGDVIANNPRQEPLAKSIRDAHAEVWLAGG